MSPGPTLARRPPPDDLDELAALALAQREFIQAERAYNLAIHRRAMAASVARHQGSHTWRVIARVIGVSPNAALELVDRYIAAVAVGKTLGHHGRRKDQR